MVWNVLLCLLWIAVSLFLILIILLQRGKGGGLVGALGGVGGSSAFGTKAGDVFTRITIGVFAVYLLLAMIGVWSMKTKQQFAGAANVPAKKESGDDKKGGPSTSGSAAGAGTSDDSGIGAPKKVDQGTASPSESDKGIEPPLPKKMEKTGSDAPKAPTGDAKSKEPASKESKDAKKADAPKGDESKKAEPAKTPEKSADQKSPSKGAGDSKDGKK